MLGTGATDDYSNTFHLCSELFHCGRARRRISSWIERNEGMGTALRLWWTEVQMYSLHRHSRDFGSGWQQDYRWRSCGVRAFDINQSRDNEIDSNGNKRLSILSFVPSFLCA